MLSNNKTFANNNLRDVQKTFNDGFCVVYEAEERTLIKNKGFFHFSNETVGLNTYFENNVRGTEIEKAIGIPVNPVLDRLDILKIDDCFYKIVEIQHKDKKKPHFFKVFLKRDVFDYEDTTT